jgi:uncharacterized protein (DUF58 family)
VLKAFTPRAAGFAAAAVALYVAGRLTGVAELYMLAVAALALPLGALAVVTWGNSRLASSRSVRPVRTSVGNRIAVTVRLDNPTRLETGVLLLEDRLPYQLGPGARFVVPGIPGGDRQLLNYELRAGGTGPDHKRPPGSRAPRSGPRGRAGRGAGPRAAARPSPAGSGCRGAR